MTRIDQQPRIQLGVVLEPKSRLEEALTYDPDLIFYLPLLPARCRRAGRRLHQIVAAHPQKAAIKLPVLADEHRFHSGLHVVVNASRTRTLKEGKCTVVRVEHHLLRLARIRPDERHPAVT